MKKSRAKHVRASVGKHLGKALAAFVMLAFASQGALAQQQPQQSKAPKQPATARKTAPSPPPVQMIIEPKVIEILKAASDRLAAARTMSFTAVVTYENPSRLGTPLAYTTKSEVTLKRPDKLRVITPADGPASEFYYDGKTMTAFAPAEKLIAQADAPPTIDAALRAAFEKADIYYPFTDLIVTDPFKAVSEGLVMAFYIGQSQVVGGTTTDMIAYANNDVFIQAWIGTEDKLPRMVRAVYRADRAALRHQLELSNWQLDVSTPDESFAPANASAAMSIEFGSPRMGTPAAVPQPPKAKPPKTK